MQKRARPRTVCARSVVVETIVHSEKSSQPDHAAATTAQRTTRTTTADPGKTTKTAGTGSVAGTEIVGAAGMEMRGGMGTDRAGGRDCSA